MLAFFGEAFYTALKSDRGLIRLLSGRLCGCRSLGKQAVVMTAADTGGVETHEVQEVDPRILC